MPPRLAFRAGVPPIACNFLHSPVLKNDSLPAFREVFGKLRGILRTNRCRGRLNIRLSGHRRLDWRRPDLRKAAQEGFCRRYLPWIEIGRDTSELQSLMRHSYAVF